MFCTLILAHVIAHKSNFYKNLTSKKHDTFEPESAVNSKLKNRHEMLDGLRGFLALGVLFQHAVTNFAYFSTDVWKITDVRFYRHAGGEAVILFFMITSFLYWSKAIAHKGYIDTKSIYKNRFYRLAPMYLFSAGIVILSVLVQTNFHIESVGILFIDIVVNFGACNNYNC
jgi:peptidoglycan/LPS O-acetylase OafA/YrhL